MTGEPAGGDLVQRGNLIRRCAAQLEVQQLREQLVVAEPGPARVQGDHEGVGVFQVLQRPFSAAFPGQQIGQLAVDPIQHARAEQ